MPLIQYKNKNDTHIAVWKVQEDLEYFKSKVTLTPIEQEEIKNLKARRLLEWYASRYLLHLLNQSTPRAAVIKDIHGKPHLTDHTQHISISHTQGYVAAMCSPRAAGIDVQVYVEKIKRIQHKFVSEKEKGHYSIDSIHDLHLLWSAKEAVYKAYGKRKIDFKNDIIILPIDDTSDTREALLKIDGDIYRYNLYFEAENEFMLVYVETI